MPLRTESGRETAEEQRRHFDFLERRECDLFWRQSGEHSSFQRRAKANEISPDVYRVHGERRSRKHGGDAQSGAIYIVICRVVTFGLV